MSTGGQPNVLRRYAAGYFIYARRLRRSQWHSPGEIRDEQLRRLQSLLREASAHVPYYRRLFQKLGARPDDFRELSDLARLPVLERTVLREQYRDFINPRHDPRTVFEDHTSGSTGVPLRVLLTFEQKSYEMAYAI